jgi:microcystin-dependent protein
LFDVCGTAWGTPTSGTVFRTPNLRGRTPVGAGDGTGNGGLNLALAATAGAEKILLNYHHIPAHAHDFEDSLNEVASGGNIVGATTADTSRGLAQDLRNVNPQGGDIAHDNVQPSIALGWYIIS